MQLTIFFLETVVHFLAPFFTLYATPAGINNLASQYTQKAHVDAVKCCRKGKLLDSNNMLNILRHNPLCAGLKLGSKFPGTKINIKNSMTQIDVVLAACMVLKARARLLGGLG